MPTGSLKLAAKRQIANAFHGSAAAARWIFDRASPAAFRALILHDVAEEYLGNLERLVHYLLAERGIAAPGDVRRSQPAPGSAGCGAPCLITFDDGFLSQYRIARDLLDPNGIKAVFFICPVLIDLAEQNDYASIARSLGYSGMEGIGPLMRWRQVQELAENGHTIGAHSQTHRRLINLPMEVLEEEVAACGKRLERIVRAPVNWFAYPFGGIGSIDQRALRCVASRYKYCCSGIRGLNFASTSSLSLLRDPMDPDWDFSYQQMILNGALDWRYVLARRRLRRMAGDAVKPDSEIRD